jgi:hypothetical protein
LMLVAAPSQTTLSSAEAQRASTRVGIAAAGRISHLTHTDAGQGKNRLEGG